MSGHPNRWEKVKAFLREEAEDGKHYLKEEAGRWKRVPKGERLSYFKTYYLLGTCFVLLILASLVLFLGDVRESSRELVLSGIAVNVPLSEEGYAFLTEGFLSKGILPDTPKQGQGRIYAGEENIIQEAEEKLDQYRKVMALTSLAASGELDYLLMDSFALEELKGTGIFLDPGAFLDPEVLERIKDSLVMVRSEERPGQAEKEEESFRVLSLQGSGFADAFLPSPEDTYLGFTCLREREDRGKALMEYLLGEQMVGDE